MAYEETKERKAFEEELFKQRFLKGITRVSETAQFPYKVDCPPKHVLLERDEQGDYKDLHVSAMWFGWSTRAKQTVI